MLGKRVLAVLLVAVAGAAGAPVVREAYFVKTVPGSWASYQLHDLKNGFKTSMKYTRLPDRGGQQVLAIETDYDAGDGTRATSTTEYSFEPGFRLEANALSFQRFATGVSVQASGADATPLPSETVKMMIAEAIDPTVGASFVEADQLAGVPADRFGYTGKAASGRTEEGELWLSPTVPFGLLKQVATARDTGGVIQAQYQLTLLSSGQSTAEAEPAPAAPVAAATPAGPVSASLAEALQKELIRIQVEVESRGASLVLTLENRTENELRVVIPAGGSSLAVADPIHKLAWTTAKEQVVVLGAGETAAPVRVKQTAPRRVTEGRFSLSVYEGTPLYSGSVTLGAER